MSTERSVRNRVPRASARTGRRIGTQNATEASNGDFVAEYARRAVAARAAQGLPPTIQDQETLERLAQAMGREPHTPRNSKKSA